MDWNRQIDAYCERLGPGFWAEPWNAVTNLGFLVAAALGLWVAWRRGRLDPPMLGLTGLVAAVGIGSFLFHTVATAWAGLADVVPILLFILGYLGTALARFGGLGWGSAGLGVLGFLAASAALAPLFRSLALGSSAGYLPAFLAMVGIGGWLAVRRHPSASGILVAAVLFGLSLSLRTFDLPLCASWPIGTHFLWHLLNAAVLGLLLVTLARHGAASDTPASCRDPAAALSPGPDRRRRSP